jgi:iron(III) transport system ATP-binding protein
MPEREPMLRIRSLAKNFGAFRAVDAISLDVRQGELVTLLGPSGCGKTTTLRCIAGLEDPTSGEIAIDGTMVSAPRERINVPPERRRIGMVFQSYALWPHMTVAENVAYPLLRQKLPTAERQARAGRALDLVGLSRYAASPPGELSGGQQQRVALARALASECRILLFDEPLSNLDVRLREQLRIEIRELQSRLKITAVYVTHDQAEALAISDRIVVMNHGRIEQIGTPGEVYSTPSSEFVATFLGQVNLLDVACVGISGDGGFHLFRDQGGTEVHLAGANCAAGQTRKFGMRAELMKLSRPGDCKPGDNQWAGVIERKVFLGDSIEYWFKGSAGTLQLRVPPYVRFSPGDAVSASIAPEDCFLIAPTQ